MNYVSGLMLGASLANMLRQTLGTSGDMNASLAQGMRGGHGRMLSVGGASALTGLLGGGRGGSSSPLTSLLGMTGSTSFPTGMIGTGKSGGRSKSPVGGVQESAPVQVRMQDAAEAPFTCVHASAGRRRYRSPYLTKAFAEVLEDLLPRLPFVTAVRANAVAGSLLLIYPPADEAHILVLAEGLAAIFAEGRTAPPPATLAQSVRRSVHAFSGWIQRNTGGALDLSSVVAGVFILRGVRQLVLGSNTPSGSQMLWWALTLMRGWKV